MRDRLKRSGPIGFEEAELIAAQIAAGLGALHHKEILHRDLKPANVMLTHETGRGAVIMDFGIAREVGGDSDGAPLTRPGLVVGTPGYMAPELMFRSGAASVASDLFSFGIILYEMVTAKHYIEPIEPGKSGLPLHWESTILRCLEKDAAARPKSASEVVASLTRGTVTIPDKATKVPLAELEPGRLIAHYRVVRKLGTSDLYLAEDSNLGRQAVLKVLPRVLANDISSREAFERDAKLVSRLNHPSATMIFGFGDWDGGYYVAFEYVEGEALDVLWRNGPLELEDIARYGTQLAELLDVAHGAGLTQLELEPRYLIISQQGLVKVLYLGLARLQEDGSRDRILSRSTEAVGYLSPEHALAKPIDVRSHVFSLGAVLYEMATGRRAFPGKTPAEVLSGVLTAVPRWSQETPPEVERIVRKCLEKKPEHRYQSARELAIDLQAWRRSGTGSVSELSRPAVAPAQGVSPAIARRKWAVTAGGAALAAAAAGVGWFGITGPAVPESLAIFPFASGNEGGQVLSDGLTESLIDQVASSGALRVLARTAVFRFRQVEDPIATAKKLQAAMLVVGKLVSDKDLVHVSLELVEVETASQRWKYAASSPFSGLQGLVSQLADQLLRALGVRNSKTASGQSKKTADPEAYRLFLRGRHTLIRRLPESFMKAADLFNRAIEIDPLYAQPYAGLADVYWLQSGDRPPNDVAPKARAAALKAIELDPSLADAHAALGSVQVHYDLAWIDSEKSFQRAISLNPSYPQARSSYARLLTARKRFLEAEEEQKKAIALDPLSVPSLTSLGMTYYYWRRFDEAEKVLLRVLADQPGSIQGRAFLGLVQVAQKNYKAAIATLEESIRRMGEDDYGLVSDLGMAYALSGDLAKGRDCLARVERMSTKYYSAPCFQAGMLLALGMKEQALTALEQSVDPDHSWPVMYYAVEPKLDPVRSEPRFLALLRKTGAVT